ncbi:MAG: sugar phosphate nucleotidyltransferase [Schwartzia sp. (in: firmicutes)]
MHIVLLSGGSGKRLWPLSNEIRSKQFIPIFRQEDGTVLSMAQRVYGQVLRADAAADVVIATSRPQVATLCHQLGEAVELSVEPCRRDTFPAIALAGAYLHDKRGVGEEEAIAICPVDPYVEDGYFAAVRELTELAAKGEASLLLMGVEPTYPSAKYGYILPRDKGRISGVEAFREKPEESEAARYIRQGALWNSGVFACRLGYVLEKARALLGASSHAALLARYEQLQPISFDYAVVEKERSISVVRYGGEWKDLGTWNTLTEVMETKSIGDVTMDEGCERAEVVNEMDVPVLCMGLRDMVVAASAEGILVADKHSSSYIKPYVERFTQQARFAEKSWGSFRILDVGEESLVVKVTLRAGHAMNYHSHAHRAEVWTVVRGRGEVLIDGVRRAIGVGDVVHLPPGCKHTAAAAEDMTLIEVQMGKEISREDKIKWEAPEDVDDPANGKRGGRL